MAEGDLNYFNIHLPTAQGFTSDSSERSFAGDDEFVAARDEQLRDLAQRVVEALYSGTEMRRFATDFASPDLAESPRFVAITEVGEVGPPEGVPLLIPEIAVLTVAAPNAAAIEKALSTLGDLAKDIIVRPVVVHSTQTEHLFVDDDSTAAVVAPSTVEVAVLAQRLPWGIARVNAPAVWQRGYRGQGIRVAIVDTGSGPHIDLPRRVAGATFVPNTNSPSDDKGHGTHVAGSALALDNAYGVVGVAPLASFMVAKVLNYRGRGNDSWIAAGIVWAANQGADVINLSLGGGFSQVIEDALRYAFNRGAVLCAAAGNNGPGSVIHPASSKYCIAVAATDRNNRRASFSALGRNLDISAPGVNILSTTMGETYQSGWNGTSMATPHVSGVCALVLSQRKMSPAELKRRLQATALNVGPWNEYGAGLIQADRAIT